MSTYVLDKKLLLHAEWVLGRLVSLRCLLLVVAHKIVDLQGTANNSLRTDSYRLVTRTMMVLGGLQSLRTQVPAGTKNS